VTFKDSGGTLTQTLDYTYDVLNRRNSQTVQDGSNNVRLDERYVYDGNSLIMVMDDDGDITHAFLNGTNG